MAWNRYYIFIKDVGSPDVADILTRLNVGQYKPLRGATLSDTNKRTILFAGIYNSNLLVVHQELALSFSSLNRVMTKGAFWKLSGIRNRCPYLK
jgi:hypothetical protein